LTAAARDGRILVRAGMEEWLRRGIVILRRRIERELTLSERDGDGQLRLGFAEIDEAREVFEYAVLVTSLDSEILSLGQLYRDRADCESSFDELKNQWGWGGFTTRDLKRCRLMAGCVALVFNWWNLFVRLADPAHHREAITSRPLLLQAIGRQTSHAGRTTVTISSSHGEHSRSRAALTRIAGFFAHLRTRAVVSNSQRCVEKISARTKTRAAATIAGRSCQLQLKEVKIARRQQPNPRI
jgi:hypothetical protein